MKRVAVTGLGVVSPLGYGREALWSAFERGASGIRPITLFPRDSLPTKLAGEVPDFDPKAILGPKGLRLLDRATRLVLAASQLALEDGGLEVGEADGNDTGVSLGSTMGSFSSRSDFFYETLANGPRSVNPALFPNTVVNSPASQVAIRFGLRAFNTTIANGFTSALEALDYGANAIRLGRARAVLAGGVEELSEAAYWALYRTGALAGSREGTEEAILPFDRRRNGFLFGEGAVMLVLEELSSAKRRGATIYAELRGGASATDMGASRRNGGSRRAIARALERSAVEPSRIGYVASGAHGSLLGDAAEGRVLSEILDGRGEKVWASSVKAMLGESVSAGGGFQAAAALLALHRGVISPTVGIEEPDDRCRIDPIANEARERRVDHVLVHSQSPMSQSAALVLSRLEG